MEQMGGRDRPVLAAIAGPRFGTQLTQYRGLPERQSPPLQINRRLAFEQLSGFGDYIVRLGGRVDPVLFQFDTWRNSEK
jgi:hypothetical protein